MIKLLPNSELEVMKVIWEKGNGVNSKDVTDAMYTKNKWARTTTLTILTRLARKGFILVDKTFRRSIYTIEVNKDDYYKEATIEFANRLYGDNGNSSNKKALDLLMKQIIDLNSAEN